MIYIYCEEDGIIHCLPESLDTENLVKITALGDRFHKYLDMKTLQVHDCAEYYEDKIRETCDK